MRGKFRGSLLCALAFTAQAADGPSLRVFPSGETLPENTLRLSIEFAAPPAEPVLERLALRSGGEVRHDAFLPQELWSPDGRTLTLLFHPGRVKSGLVAHDTLGRALQAGSSAALLLDGKVLGQWQVVAPDLDLPRPQTWQLEAPKAGTRAPLIVRLDAPIDARARDYIAVRDAAGARVPGSARLDEGERVWRFVPTHSWSRARHVVVVHPALEDPAGNRVDRGFETGASATGRAARSHESVFSAR